MSSSIQHSTRSSNLADILERVLDKGIVVAGDITVALADVELLQIRIRLLIASVDKAEQIGINWWKTDPLLSTDGSELARLREENQALKQRLDELEKRFLDNET